MKKQKSNGPAFAPGFILLRASMIVYAVTRFKFRGRKLLGKLYIMGLFVPLVLGTPLDIASDPMKEYIRAVFDTCAFWKIAAGIFVDNASMIAPYRAMGCNIFWTGTEISLLCEALGSVCAAFQSVTKAED